MIPAPPAASKKPALTLRTTKLKRTGKRVSVALACADAPCKGTVTAKYAGGTAAKSVKYSLAAGARKTLQAHAVGQGAEVAQDASRCWSASRSRPTAATTVSKKLRLKK